MLGIKIERAGMFLINDIFIGHLLTSKMCLKLGANNDTDMKLMGKVKSMLHNVYATFISSMLSLL